jgi:hypothetical protein
MSFDARRAEIEGRAAALDADKYLGLVAAHAVNRPVGEWGGTSLSLAEAAARGLVQSLRTLRQCRERARLAGAA